jgi:hypothetical protein
LLLEKHRKNMSKNKNKNTNHNQSSEELRTSKYPLPVPEVANMDEIGYYPDDLLADRIGRLESERTRLLEMRYDPQLWEVELAYLRREQQIRTVRSERHEAYMRDLVLRSGEDEVSFNTEFGALQNNVVSNPRILN